MAEPIRIEVKELTRHFTSTKAVDGISFTFESGHIFGFVGPNGAGKTTTLRILATLDEPTSGDAFINGVSVRDEPEKTRQQVGFVPDALPAHSDVTVYEYLDFFARACGLTAKRRVQAIRDVMEFTRLAPIQEKLLKDLSKGMKQRVSLGRALVHDPAVLIMDEPASGLDPRARVEFRELLVTLAGMGKAILISSHILTELTEICNGVVIIERGRILETGTIAEVIARSAPRRVVAMRTLDDRAHLCHALLQMPGVENARDNNGDVHVELSGSDDACHELLNTLIRGGHRLIEFKILQADLEDIFMRVTRGDVQ